MNDFLGCQTQKCWRLISKHSPLDTETSETRARIRYIWRLFCSVHFFNLILEMVFPSVIFLFLIIYCLINSFWFYFCTRTREIQIFPWGLCTLMVTFTEDWVDSCICAILRYTTHCRCIQDGLIQSKQCWLLYPLQTEYIAVRSHVL